MSREEVRHEWSVRRERLLEEYRAVAGSRHRPWAWWQFDAREPQPEPSVESERLLELGIA